MGFELKFLKIILTASITLVVGCGGAPAAPGDSGVADDSATISFESQTFDELTLKGQGGEEISVISFKVADLEGQSLSGESVGFEISSEVGGARILSDSGTSNTSGVVSVAVQSGTVAVALHVTATLSGRDIRAVSDEIQVSTSTFIASSFSFAIELSDDIVFNDAFGAFDVFKAADLVGFDVTLSMAAVDQFGHKVRDGSRATIVSPETGLVEPSTCEMSGGECSLTWSTTEGSVDGRIVTVLAYASGAEEFEDVNGNNIYDIGEAFVDLGEVYVDEDENGSYGVGEFFLDANGNEAFDVLGNGVWDGPCVVEDVNLCLGESSTFISTSIRLRLLNCPGGNCS